MQAAAREKGYHKLVGRIIAANDGARKLCQETGWKEVGTHEKHGKLDGVWRDVVVIERLIPENID